jgi:pimeloyl-ACP methyl ester carboxylesterase
MMCLQAAILGASFLLQTPPDGSEGVPAEFQAWFHAAERGDLVIPAAVNRRARQFRYVFVGGFANERMPGYFSQCSRELRARGVPKSAIHFIFPSSHRTSEENAEEVRDQFFEIAREGEEKLVVIAHSRGACDTLAFALQNGSFIRDRVQALFLVQGAFGGTGVADYVMGEGSLMDHRMPPRLRLLAYLLGKFENFRLHRGKHEGLLGLTRDESGRFWGRMLADHAEAIPLVGPKTFYIASQVEPARLRLFHRALATYLRTYYGPNDGVVALRDQSLPGLGTVLAVLDAGHSDLTHASRAPRRLRRALIQSIVMEVGGAEAEPPTDASRPKVRTRRRGLLTGRRDPR